MAIHKSFESISRLVSTMWVHTRCTFKFVVYSGIVSYGIMIYPSLCCVILFLRERCFATWLNGCHDLDSGLILELQIVSFSLYELYWSDFGLILFGIYLTVTLVYWIIHVIVCDDG